MTNYHVGLNGTFALGSDSDEFVHGLSVISTAEPSALAVAVQLAWEDAWADPLGAVANLFPTTVTYTDVTVAAVLDPIAGTLFAAFHQPFNAGLSGTSAAPSIPSQNAIAVSLTAGQRPNGTYIKGRFYLPSPATNALEANTALLTPTARTTIADNMAGFVTALKVAGHQPAVWSRVLGTFSPVQQLRVGSKVDTQRRRRNDSVEVYVARPI